MYLLVSVLVNLIGTATYGLVMCVLVADINMAAVSVTAK
jgi:hypothetical protein